MSITPLNPLPHKEIKPNSGCVNSVNETRLCNAKKWPSHLLVTFWSLVLGIQKQKRAAIMQPFDIYTLNWWL